MSLEAFLTKLFNKTEDELKALIYDVAEDKSETLKPNADQILIDLYSEHIVKNNKKNEQAKFDQGYQKANKEIAERYKKALKEKLKFDTDKEDIDEVFDELNETITKKSKSTLTDDQVKSHDVFLKRERELNDAIKKMNEDFENEKSTLIKDYQRKENLTKVKEKAEAVLLASGAVLSEDPTRRKNQINVFLNQFEGYDYDLSKDDPLILKGDQRLEDKFGNPIKFDDFITEQAKSLFDIKVQENRGGSGAEGGGAGLSFVFKDQSDFSNKYNSEPDRAKRIQMAEAWEKSQSK